jgi:hypothetical protein
LADSPEPDNIPIASQRARNKELTQLHRHQKQFSAGMDADDRKYISHGHTLVDLQEHFTDDHTTMSGTELERERQRRNIILCESKGKEIMSEREEGVTAKILSMNKLPTPEEACGIWVKACYPESLHAEMDPDADAKKKYEEEEEEVKE